MDSNLSYKEKYDWARSNFCTYINRDEDFSSEEKTYLNKIIVNDNISGILYISSILTAWSFIAGLIDSILCPDNRQTNLYLN